VQKVSGRSPFEGSEIMGRELAEYPFHLGSYAPGLPEATPGVGLLKQISSDLAVMKSRTLTSKY
jgi:hypothetical protein